MAFPWVLRGFGGRGIGRYRGGDNSALEVGRGWFVGISRLGWRIVGFAFIYGCKLVLVLWLLNKLQFWQHGEDGWVGLLLAGG